MNSSHAFSHSRMIAAYLVPHFSVSSSSAARAAVGFDGGVDRLHVALDRVPVPPGGEPEGVADQVDDAGLHDGLRPHVADHLGQSLEAVADQEERVLDAAVAEVGQHAHPELRALTAGAGPQPEDVLLPGQGDPDRGIDRPVRDLAVADLDHDRVDEDRGVDLAPAAGPARSAISSTTLSVIRETVSFDTEAP